MVEKHPGNISVRPINQLHALSICMSLSKVCLFPTQIPDVFWPAKGRNSKSRAADSEDSCVGTWLIQRRTQKENNQEEETRMSMRMEVEM